MPTIIKRDGKPIGIAETDSAGLGVLAWFHTNIHSSSMAHALEHEGYSTEDVEDVDCHEVEPLLSAIAERLGITMEATFIPFSRSKHAAPHQDGTVWRSLNWRMVFKHHGRSFLETDYAQGEGYAPSANDPDKPERRYRVMYECETGKKSLGVWWGSKPEAYGEKPIKPPSIGAVLHSLSLDSSALDAATFEEWARDYGYDPDSREAERIYRACIDIATRLRATIGEHGLQELRLASQYN